MMQQPATSLPVPPETSLLQKARAGDLQAFRQLVRLHQAEVFGIALQFTSEHVDAFELAHDAFVDLHSAIARIANPAHLGHWLARAISHRAYLSGYRADPGSSANPQDPGEDFTARVLAHVELRWSHRRADFAATRARRHRRGRAMLIGSTALLIVVALAAMWWQGNTHKPLATTIVAAKPASSDAPLDASPPGTAAGAGTAAASRTTPPQDAFPAYTLIVLPVRHASPDANAIGAVEAFQSALIAELRKDPAITLLVPGVTAPPDIQQSADHVLAVTSLETRTLPSGGTAFRITDGRGGSLSAGSPASGRQWPVEIRIRPLSQTQSEGFTSTLQLGEDNASLPQLAAKQVEVLRAQMFPNALIRQQLMTRYLDTSLPPAERNRSLSDLLGTRRSGQELTAIDLGVIVGGAATMPADERAQLWRNLRGNASHDLLEPLINSVRLDPDLVVRFDALATLAADYNGEARARSALEIVSKEDPEQVMRMAARRALSGDAEWRSYVIRSLKDSRLSLPERMEPLLLAGRSATTPAETLALRKLVNDEETTNLLMGLVRENWFDYTQAETIGDAFTLLADSDRPAASGLLVEIPRESPRPGATPAFVAAAPPISPAALAWLQKNRNNPRARRMLDDLASGKASPQTGAMIEQMMQPRPGARRVN